MTLSDRLKAAALDRAQVRGEQIDDFVLEPDGVIDLRKIGRDTALRGRPMDSPLPRLDPEDTKVDLWHERTAGRPLWRKVSRPRPDTDVDDRSAAAESPDETVIELGRETIELDDSPKLTRLADVPLLGTTAPVSEASSPTTAEPPPRFDTGDEDEARRTAPCPKCEGNGQEDLFDRVSATSYFSCDECAYMWQHRHDN